MFEKLEIRNIFSLKSLIDNKKLNIIFISVNFKYKEKIGYLLKIIIL